MAAAADRRISARLVGVLAIAAVAGVAPPARADEAEAEEAFAEGRKLMERGSYAAACEAFAHSQRLDPAPGTLLNLGLCHERLGHVATSYAKFQAAAELAAREDDEARERVAKERAKALEPRLPMLKVELAGEHPPGLEVAVDDEDITSKLGVAVPVDPDLYELEAAAPGRESWKRTITVSEEGVTKAVTVPDLEEKHDQTERSGKTAPEADRDSAGETPRALEADRPADQAREPGKALRIAGLSTAGAGVAAAATGLAFGLHARSTWRRSQDHCDESSVCSHRGIDLATRAGRSADLSTILVGAGVAAAATGALLWLQAPSSESASPAPSTRLVPAASGEILGLSLRGRF